LASSSIGPIIQFMNGTLPQSGVELDVCRYPNPFHGLAKNTFIDSSQTVLSMVDGGEDGEVIPLQPLLVKAREVDVIIAIDAVRCEYDIDFGTSLIIFHHAGGKFVGMG
jgi:lysophospholipase